MGRKKLNQEFQELELNQESQEETIESTASEKPKKYEFYFKVNEGVGTRSVAIDELGVQYKFLREGQYYSHEDLGENPEKIINKLKSKKEYVVDKKYRDDIGIMEDRGEAPIAGFDENNKPIYGLPREEVNIIQEVNKTEYDTRNVVVSKTRVNKSSPWLKGVR